MGCKRLLMSPTSEIMIHNVSGAAEGDYRDMDHMSGVLQNTNKIIANAYCLKSRLPRDEVLTMMNNETWLTPEQASHYGLIDGTLFMDKDTESQTKLNILKGGSRQAETERLRAELDRLKNKPVPNYAEQSEITATYNRSEELLELSRNPEILNQDKFWHEVRALQFRFVDKKTCIQQSIFQAG